ncbi:uncharacterized protein LOC122577321 [Bombus pyrosoma]|uniref:uncharacterized protein LOC122577321 n=1 Tax=Bombus pyrosoma TaxID=396416 RepID=UPI001CB91E91|nr:uncharacterized protein LOC122577321 [Bombus pyrosoma]
MSKTSTNEDSEISLKQVLDAIQRQNEIHARTTAEIQQQIQILAKRSSEESQRLAKEIKLLRKTVAELKLCIESKQIIMTTDFESVSNTTKKTAKSRNRDRVPVASAPETIFDPDSDNDDEFQKYNEPRHLTMLSAEDAIRYVPTLNGDDDIGVENFIKEVRAMRMRCSQKDLLLKAIKIDKIVGKAAQSIRNTPIESYADLHDALRSNVVVEVTSDEYEEQLRDLRQGRYESVQSFNMRFRLILNKLTYAITSENPQPITRRIMIEATMKKVSGIYSKGLRHDIGRILLASKLDSLNETEKKAVDIERYLRKQKESRRTGTRPTVTYNRLNNKPMQTSNRPLLATRNNPINKNISPFSKTEHVPFAERQQVKCFKCGKLGHVAPQCENFQLTNQIYLPSPRVRRERGSTTARKKR